MSRTFGEIQFELTHFCRAGDLPGVDAELLRGWINEAYRSLLDKRQWKGLEVNATLQTTTTYRTGTVAITSGATAVTGTGTTFTAGMTGRRFRIPGSLEFYIFTYVSATSGTIERAYEGATVTAAAFEIFQNVYQLPARVKMIATMRNPRIGISMELITESNLDRVSAARAGIGEPLFFSPSADTTDVSPPIYKQVEIYPAPETAIGLPYTYIRLPIEFDGTNTTAAILPWVEPRAIIAGAKALIMAHFRNYPASREERILAREGEKQMAQVETDTVGPSHLRMARRYTRHRRARGSWAG